MIVYAPLWRTMEEQKVTTYTLRVKHGMSHATVQRLQADMPVSTHTLNKLCAICIAAWRTLLNIFPMRYDNTVQPLVCRTVLF